ncbi:hypothetical protein CORC01_04457 [Colletotrichum orchidophilum]|uniref:Uncharacterized protein n=1 Tax=Colletotrichum orchidophilum TaxID=1209926 RepID=A0A1G4BFZ1_9PEZI|nr:uncharacterized protein CORC01_04457 [Colletotrichum orchidophilum]OHF00268.1 hypothetical protein CORC01_04457 [Colletotrichum orchidophilum]
MYFTISPPTPREASQIVSIHISSMSSNPLLLLILQFPTEASLADLHDYLIADVLQHLAHNPSRILVARVKSDSNSDAGDEVSGGGGGGHVVSFVKFDIVRRRRRSRTGDSMPNRERDESTATGSQKLRPGKLAAADLDYAKEKPLQDGQHLQQSKAEWGGDEASAEEDESEEAEKWPASASQEYLTAYATTASKARREAMGSRPLLRE